MYTDDDVDGAVAAGRMSAEAAMGLRAFVLERKMASAADEEHFRLLTGFNDIFVTIAAILILVALAWLGNRIDATVGGMALAATSWGFAEYFTRRRRMALPSIVLLLGFAAGVFWAALGSFAFLGFHEFADSKWWVPMGAAATAFATYLHWRRFVVPITVAAGAAALAATAITLVLAMVPAFRDLWRVLMLTAGLAVFVLAMRWDRSDLARTTRRSDVAFWLHLLAAPLIVHPIFTMLGMITGDRPELWQAALAVTIYAALALVALAIDRRAVLVSALAYVLFAMRELFRAAGSIGENFAMTALVIGSGLLLLSASWRSARKAVVGRLPPGLRSLLPAA